MKDKLTPKEKELYRQTDETLHYLWDPIGVKGIPQARDEYHSYLPRVFSMLIAGSKDSEIAEYLVKVEENSMGLSSNKENAMDVARNLINIKTWIIDETS